MDKHEQFNLEVQNSIKQIALDTDLQALSRIWIREAAHYKWEYNFTWLGRPIIQFPGDVFAMQELIWKVKPDLIIETGIAHGGSLIFSASMLALLDYCDTNRQNIERKVLGIDIEIRSHNRVAIQSHPLANRIEILEGSSVNPDIIKQVSERASFAKRVMVFLDSNHSHNHVLLELEAYGKIVTPSSYCIVLDTGIEDMPPGSFPDRPWGKGDNPKTAVWEFLKNHPEFEIDKSIQHKLLITAAPDGYLRKKY
ncbi:cephalosporin hydroxylase family protein [Gloeomargaritales cyanobacterium VI4D9]|nr:cephalosporin hydroxylase family protein [Gloeomargaritales cyanobacterium VI4D9]